MLYDGEERRAGHVKMAEDIAYIRGVLETHVQTVTQHMNDHRGLPERVQSLETNATRQWLVSAVIGPLVVFGHVIARKVGIDI